MYDDDDKAAARLEALAEEFSARLDTIFAEMDITLSMIRPEMCTTTQYSLVRELRLFSDICPIMAAGAWAVPPRLALLGFLSNFRESEDPAQPVTVAEVLLEPFRERLQNFVDDYAKVAQDQEAPAKPLPRWELN